MAQDEISIPEGEELEREMEKAWRLYQANVLKTEVAMFSLTRGVKAGRPAEELLETALEALEKCGFPEGSSSGAGKGTGAEK